MIKFREELEWYWQKKVYVYPYYSVMDVIKWSEWRNIKDADYIERMNSYNGEGVIGLKLVTGKKGVCGVGIRRDNDDRFTRGVLYNALSLFELPKDYTWILQTPHEYIIIVDLVEGLSNNDPKKFENLRIYWEADIQLPNKYEKTSYPVQYFLKFYPQNHPAQIPKTTLYKGINELIEEGILFEDRKPWWKKIFHF